mmetsp:Transcript_24963/g.99143  ORF Transcript_24963/g.99143 Transcript_24963/m.99143 type:complete len:95 (-) Transcript_24963:416-700(-)
MRCQMWSQHAPDIIVAVEVAISCNGNKTSPIICGLFRMSSSPEFRAAGNSIFNLHSAQQHCIASARKQFANCDYTRSSCNQHYGKPFEFSSTVV